MSARGASRRRLPLARPHPRLANPIAFASNRALDHESGDLTTPEDPPWPPPRRQTPTCSRPNRLVSLVLSDKTARHRPARRRVRFAGDLQISIARAPPNSALPPRGFLLGRLSNAGPTTRTTVPHGAGVRNPRMRAAKSSAQVLVSVNSDYQTGCAPCQPRIRRDPAIPNHDPCIREKEFLAAGPIFTSAP